MAFVLTGEFFKNSVLLSQPRNYSVVVTRGVHVELTDARNFRAKLNSNLIGYLYRYCF